MSMDMLSRVFDILQRVGGMEQINRFMMAIYGVICVFGLLNCILGYRILRFWMMLFGFLIGACTGFGVTYLSGVGAPDSTVITVISAVIGKLYQPSCIYFISKIFLLDSDSLLPEQFYSLRIFIQLQKLWIFVLF